MKEATLQRITAVLLAATIAVWTTPNPHVQSIDEQATAIDRHTYPEEPKMSKIPYDAKINSEELTNYKDDEETEDD